MRPRHPHHLHPTSFLLLITLLPPLSLASPFSFSSFLLPHRRAFMDVTDSFIPSNYITGGTAANEEQPLIAGDYICKSLGECEACPETELSTPLCRLYGNRRALSCTTTSPISDLFPHTTTHPNSNPNAAVGPPPPPGQPPPPLLPGKNHASNPTDPDGVLHMPPEEKVGGANANVGAGAGGEGGKGIKVDSDPLGVDDETIADKLREAAKGNVREGRSITTSSGRRILREENEYEALRERVRRQGSGQLHELRTWEACEKVVTKERADFFEFVLTNAFFAFASLIVFLFRHRTLASRQYGRLAARIGVTVQV